MIRKDQLSWGSSKRMTATYLLPESQEEIEMFEHGFGMKVKLKLSYVVAHLINKTYISTEAYTERMSTKEELLIG